jgi:hypothetical protein
MSPFFTGQKDSNIKGLIIKTISPSFKVFSIDFETTTEIPIRYVFIKKKRLTIRTNLNKGIIGIREVFDVGK